MVVMPREAITIGAGTLFERANVFCSAPPSRGAASCNREPGPQGAIILKRDGSHPELGSRLSAEAWRAWSGGTPPVSRRKAPLPRGGNDRARPEVGRTRPSPGPSLGGRGVRARALARRRAGRSRFQLMCRIADESRIEAGRGRLPRTFDAAGSDPAGSQGLESEYNARRPARIGPRRCTCYEKKDTPSWGWPLRCVWR